MILDYLRWSSKTPRCPPPSRLSAKRPARNVYAETCRSERRYSSSSDICASSHAIIVAAWHLLTTGETYQDLGGDYFEKRRDPQRQVQHLVRKLAELGYQATLEPAAA